MSLIKVDAPPKVSICAVTCRNLNDTMEFVYTVLKNTIIPFEFIIVDNASTPDVKSFLSSLTLPNIKIVYNKENEGIGKAMCDAMMLAQTEYIFRCDTDVLVPYNFAQQMIDHVQSIDNVGVVGPAITRGRPVQHDTYLETDFINSHCILIPRTTIDKIQDRMKQEEERVIRQCQEELTGKQAYVKQHEHLQSIIKYLQQYSGYWDPGYFYGADDFDYSFMAKFAGLKLIIARNVVTNHREASMDAEWKEARHKAVFEGFQYFRTKWERLLNFYGEPGKGWTDVWDCLPINKDYLQKWSVEEYLETRRDSILKEVIK